MNICVCGIRQVNSYNVHQIKGRAINPSILVAPNDNYFGKIFVVSSSNRSTTFLQIFNLDKSSLEERPN